MTRLSNTIRHRPWWHRGQTRELSARHPDAKLETEIEGLCKCLAEAQVAAHFAYRGQSFSAEDSGTSKRPSRRSSPADARGLLAPLRSHRAQCAHGIRAAELLANAVTRAPRSVTEVRSGRSRRGVVRSAAVRGGRPALVHAGRDRRERAAQTEHASRSAPQCATKANRAKRAPRAIKTTAVSQRFPRPAFGPIIGLHSAPTPATDTRSPVVPTNLADHIKGSHQDSERLTIKSSVCPHHRGQHTPTPLRAATFLRPGRAVEQLR